MRTEKKPSNIWHYLILASFLLFIFLAIIRLGIITLKQEIDNINLAEFAAKRNTRVRTLYATRGRIFDSSGNVLAQNVTAYNLIAYLAESRTTNPAKPRHVVDKEKTAKLLAPIINMEESTIYALLTKENLYQVELGPGGNGLSLEKKEEIEALGLPGLGFMPVTKRYYPNGAFASYTLGYAKSNNGSIYGEMGIEYYLDNLLRGVDGYLEYQQDKDGIRIPGTPEIRKDPISGKDIYLTLDSNIQLFVESALEDCYKKYNPELVLMTVMDAKTGAILGTSSYPNFNPNIRDITSYNDPLVSYNFEPGSIMKTYTFMTAIDIGLYNGEEKFRSGRYEISEDIVINDWDRKGWGMITFDEGFLRSANTAVVNLLKNIKPNILEKYFKRFGFTTKTNIELPREMQGALNFSNIHNYYTSGFGQGMTSTIIQQIQALTPIANNGHLIQPYLIDKIIDPDTNEIIYKAKVIDKGQVVKEETIEKMKELMDGVINNPIGTGYRYHIEGYDIIGKTGTAQIPNVEKGGYYTGYNDYIYSFAGMFPKDDPKIIIFSIYKRPNVTSSSGLAETTKEVIINTAEYLEIFPNKNENNIKINEFIVSSYLNKEVNTVLPKLINSGIDVIVLGNGEKVIKQYPFKGDLILTNEKVFLLTNDEIKMPNIIGWSLRDVNKLAYILNLNLKVEGSGYVKKQSIKEGEIVNSSDELIVILD